jgi:hypothetical protein
MDGHAQVHPSTEEKGSTERQLTYPVITIKLWEGRRARSKVMRKEQRRVGADATQAVK